MFKQIYEREIGIGEIMSGSWSIYTRYFKAILLITLAIYVPINIVLYLLNDMTTTFEGFRQFMIVIQLMEALFGIIAIMGIAVIVEKSTLNEEDSEISWGESINSAFSRWGSCIRTNILAGLILLGLTLLLIVPGIIWALYYSFIIQVVVLRGLAWKEALDYSKSIVKGQWWSVFGVLFVLNFVNLILAFGVGFVANQLPGPMSILTDSVTNVISAYFTVATTLYFLNKDFLKFGVTKSIE